MIHNFEYNIIVLLSPYILLTQVMENLYCIRNEDSKICNIGARIFPNPPSYCMDYYLADHINSPEMAYY